MMGLLFFSPQCSDWRQHWATLPYLLDGWSAPTGPAVAELRKWGPEALSLEYIHCSKGILGCVCFSQMGTRELGSLGDPPELGKALPYWPLPGAWGWPGGRGLKPSSLLCGLAFCLFILSSTTDP